MGFKVLTVDDSKTLRMIVRSALAPFGVNVIEAENGALGLDTARAEKPDLVLLDYNMPVMDGRTTLEKLRVDASTKPIPVIMLTTESAKDTVVDLLKMGLSGYIVKPFKKEDLVAKVNSVLKLYEGDTPPTPEELAQIAADAAKIKVLAVDDKPNVLALLADQLPEDFKVTKATSGTEAVSAIESTPPDVLFLDIDMPGTSGLDVYRTTGKKLREKGTLVIGMALRTEVADVTRAKKVGIREVLMKPFDANEVEEVIATIRRASGQGGGAESAQTFVESRDGTMLLIMPPPGDSKLRSFSSALGTRIVKEIKDMAEEGSTELVVEVSAALSDVNLAKSFIHLLDQAKRLSINVKLVAGSGGAKRALADYAEFSSLPTCGSVDEALASLS
jgi:two-component system cell cycle response regulator